MKTAINGNNTKFEKAFTWWSNGIRNLMNLGMQAVIG